MSEVDYPYFEEICKKTNAKWYIGYHSLDDLKRLLSFVDKMNLREIMVLGVKALARKKSLEPGIRKERIF